MWRDRLYADGRKEAVVWMERRTQYRRAMRRIAAPGTINQFVGIGEALFVKVIAVWSGR